MCSGTEGQRRHSVPKIVESNGWETRVPNVPLEHLAEPLRVYRVAQLTSE